MALSLRYVDRRRTYFGNSTSHDEIPLNWAACKNRKGGIRSRSEPTKNVDWQEENMRGNNCWGHLAPSLRQQCSIGVWWVRVQCIRHNSKLVAQTLSRHHRLLTFLPNKTEQKHKQRSWFPRGANVLTLLCSLHFYNYPNQCNLTFELLLAEVGNDVPLTILTFLLFQVCFITQWLNGSACLIIIATLSPSCLRLIGGRVPVVRPTSVRKLPPSDKPRATSKEILLLKRFALFINTEEVKQL